MTNCFCFCSMNDWRKVFRWKMQDANFEDLLIKGHLSILPATETFPFIYISDRPFRGTNLKSVTHIPQWWSFAVIPNLKEIRKNKNHVTHCSSSDDISIFHQKSTILILSGNTDKSCILIQNFKFFWLLLGLYELFWLTWL